VLLELLKVIIHPDIEHKQTVRLEMLMDFAEHLGPPFLGRECIHLVIE
jgi:hypothetical protein